MKNILLYIIFGLALPISASAIPVKATISTSNFHKIRVSIDGVLWNKRPAREVSINHIKPGRHHARIEVFGKHGKRVIHDQIYLKGGFESRFLVNSRYGHTGIVRTELHPLRYVAHGRPFNAPIIHKVIINPATLNSLADRLERARFDGDKLNIVHNELKYVNVYAEDIALLMQFFTYESSRLDIARYAYPKIIDKENIYLVQQSFRFDTTRREFERYWYRYPI